MNRESRAPAAAPITINEADFPRDLTSVRVLFREYAAGVGVDLCFQGFDAEVASLRGRYVRPDVRGLNVGRQLVERICDHARALRYTRLRLDTLPSMSTARGRRASVGAPRRLGVQRRLRRWLDQSRLMRLRSKP